jgi:AmmeMemoRadiSam system protein B
MVRRAAVAGHFYSGTKEGLIAEVAEYIDKKLKKEDLKGVLVPHAGFIFSGAVAGAVYSRLMVPDTFIILGPNHTGRGVPAAIMTKDAWQTPLGEVEIDSELAAKILAKSAHLAEDERAHFAEHSIEVQLPFLQYLGTDFKFIPLCLSRLDLETCRQLGVAITESIAESGKKVVIVASSDLTHYESQEEAQKKDRIVLDAVVGLDPGELFRKVEEHGISMCGSIPATVMLIAAKKLGAQRGEVVKYMTSGQINGDYSRVVGYGGVLIK